MMIRECERERENVSGNYISLTEKSSAFAFIIMKDCPLSVGEQTVIVAPLKSI
jgi:hypothetical protein